MPAAALFRLPQLVALQAELERQGVSLQRVSGHWWSGEISFLHPVAAPSGGQPFRLDWRPNWAWSDPGIFGLDLNLEHSLTQARSQVRWHAAESRVALLLRGDLDLDLLAASLSEFELILPGVVQLADVHVDLISGGLLSAASGQVRWSGGEVGLPPGSAVRQVVLDPLLGSLDAEEGDLIVSVKPEAGGEEWMQLRLNLPEQLEISVRRRLPAALGLAAGAGNPEDVVLQLRQPLGMGSH